MLHNIQALRALAALMVVVHHLVDAHDHYIGTAFAPIGAAVGAAGVDVFFVVSGYIMAEVIHRRPVSAGAFLLDRVIRIVPLYALLTLVAAAALAAGLRLFGHAGLDATHLWTSLAFVHGHVATESRAFPVLHVGWTLEHEAFFYALLAVALLVVPARRASLVAAALVVLVLVAATVAVQAGVGGLAVRAQPIVLEFVAGIGLWWLLRRWRAPVAVGGALLVAGVVVLLAGEWASVPASTPWGRVLWWGLPAVAIVAGAVALEQRGLTWRDPFVRAVGDASYSLYLVHIFVIQAIGKAAMVLGLDRAQPVVLAVLAVAAALSVLVSLGMHRWVELPLTAALKSRCRPASSALRPARSTAAG